MTAPGVDFEGLGDFCTNWIEVNILEKLEQVSFSIAQDGFIPTLKKMSNGPETSVIVHGIGLVQPLHNLG